MCVSRNVTIIHTTLLRFRLIVAMPKIYKRAKNTQREKPYSTRALANSRRSINSINNIMSSPATTKQHTEVIQSSLSEDEFSSPNASKSPSNSELLQYLKRMDKKQCTKDDLKQLNDALTKSIDSVNTKANSNEASISELKQRLSQIEAQQAMAHYDNELSKQKQLRNNVSIMGLPQIQDEHAVEIALDVFALLNCTIKPDDIDYAYRFKSNKDRTGNIIVKLLSYEHKMEILNAKAKKVVKVGDVVNCEAPIGNQFVFVNNHVTPFFAKLLFHGRQAIKNGQAFSCWLTSAGCNAKFTEEGKPFIYKSTAELNALIQKYAAASSSKTSTEQSSNQAPANDKPKKRRILTATTSKQAPTRTTSKK